ncbi:HAD-IA family hydrolase [Janthinobacterium lividum]|nr:HAD-IA family hydrolase [Janthinobacterium lividum]
MRMGRKSGIEVPASAAVDIMSARMGLVDAADHFKISVDHASLVKLESDLQAELASISLFLDAAPTLNSLRAAGYKIAICSNLAAPYASPVAALLPQKLDAYAWSFEVGATKPNFRIYEVLCNALDCQPDQVLMVGDTVLADYTGPQAFGIHTVHLARKGKSPVLDNIESLDQVLSLLGVP